MSNGAHTPGPWSIEERYTDSYAINPNVAWLGASSSDKEGENEANAHLIAAAPDLLVALEEVLSCISETRGADARAAVEMAQAAINKAKGEA